MTKDKLTGRMIYLTAEVEPECEGGIGEIMRHLNKMNVPASLVTEELQSTYVIGFIVEADGRISGERVISGGRVVGKEALKALKGLTWHPGKCNGRKVPVLHKMTGTVCFNAE